MNAKILYLSFLVLIPFLAVGQRGNLDQDLAEARKLAESGRFAEAEQLYSRILGEHPNSLEALTGAGYNYSWSKQHELARLRFEAALAIDPNHAEALIGQGYNHAWSGNYAAAINAFQRLQTLQPDDQEAPKGLGYVHLWQGDGRAAEQYFRDLTLKYPTVTEYRVALAQSYLAINEVKKARLALHSALQLDSSNRAAADLLKSTYGAAAPLELDVWAGYSATDGERKYALRTLQLTGQLSRKLRMYLKYDNSLTADLAALVRANQDAQALSLGAVNSWNNKLTTRLEFGARLLPDNVNQQILSGEQVFFFGNGMLVKAGGFYGWSSKIANEWLAYSSVRLPVTKWYAVEPYFFLSRVENAPRTESRFLLNNQFRSLKGYELNIGLLYGRAGVGDDVSDDKIYGSYATAILPFSQVLWGQLSFRWEQTPFADLTIVAAGIKLRLEK